MISDFLHLLFLVYITAAFAGKYAFLPITFAVFWAFVTFVAVFMHFYAPISREAQKDEPDFFKENLKGRWLIALWVALLQVFSNPSRLLLGTLYKALPQTLPVFFSAILYFLLSRPVFYGLYNRLKSIISPEETAKDFLRARLTLPILFFPPIILWLVIEDLTSSDLAYINEIKMLSAAPVFFICLYVFAPSLFNRAWHAKDNTDLELESVIKKTAEKADTPISGVKIWDTFNEPVPNAAVAGICARYRFVYITEYLLNLFSIKQLEGVIAHELGHIRLGHLLTYFLYSLSMVLISVCLKMSLVAYLPHLYSESELYSLIETLVFLGIFAVSFTAIARYCEYQADLFAAGLTSSNSIASALQALGAIITEPSKKMPEWLITHPSIKKRVSKINNSVSPVKELIKRSRALKGVFLLICLVFFALSIRPVTAVFKIAQIHKAVSLYNHNKAQKLYEALPSRLASHPLVIKETAKMALQKGNFLSAFAMACAVKFNIPLNKALEILHHSGSPKVAFNLEVVKLILKPLDFL